MAVQRARRWATHYVGVDKCALNDEGQLFLLTVGVSYSLEAASIDMAWSFRKRINLGPFRINLSKKGVGYSIGGTGIRAGRDAQGREYTQISIPGTGIYNRQYYSSGPPVKPSPQPAPLPGPPAPSPAPGSPSRYAQLSPSARYLLLLTTGAGALWVLLRFLLH